MEDVTEDRVLVVDDLLGRAPVEAGRLGHHTVLKSPDVRIVVLAFEAGHLLKEHSAPKTLLMQALDGHLLVTVGGREVDLRPGMLMRVEALERHEVRAVEDSRLMLTLVG